MQPSLQVLPVQVIPESEESGLGFLLRLARQNGITLQALASWTGVRLPHAVTSDGVRALAFVAEVSPSWLGTRLIQRRQLDGMRCREWLNQVWTSPTSLRETWPQVCTSCLRQGVPCLSAWEVTGAFACVLHRRLLIDTCGCCRERLSWFRPAIDVCRCGHYLSASAIESALPEVMVNWVEAVTARMRGENLPDRGIDSWPAWMNGLSAEGMTMVIHALGVVTKPHERISAHLSKAPLPAATNAAIVGRALARLPRFQPLDRAAPPDLKSHVHVSSLEWLALRGASAADRDISRQLVDWLTDVPRVGRSLTGRRTRRQLDLFV